MKEDEGGRRSRGLGRPSQPTGHLEADGQLIQRQLGDRLSLTSGAVTMLVDRLEHASWVRRRPHPTDRRYVLVELAPEALERVPSGLVDYHTRIRTIAGKVAAEDREVIRSFLTAVADAASEAATELRR